MTKQNKYKPTAAEKKLLEVLLVPENTSKNVTELCNLAGISRNKYYDAMKKVEFTDLVNGTTMDLIKGKVYGVLNATYMHALGEKGHQDRKLLLSMVGLYTEKTEATISARVNQGPNAFDELSAEELRKLIDND